MKYQDYIKGLIPETQERETFFNALGKPLTKSVSPVPHRINLKDFEKRAQSYNRKLEKPEVYPDGGSYYIHRDDTSIPLGNHRLHQCGYFYMQEVAASLPASLIHPKSGSLVLDMCAAP
jgi:16S rRNA C967 or C1407 C5-methylase (RsmB/RsmF family)